MVLLEKIIQKLISDNKKHGYGTENFAVGDKYVGNYMNNINIEQA